MKPASVERRLAAILFTDIVGYTRAMAESEAKGLRLRRRHTSLVSELVRRYHGAWIEERGDESLSSFASAVEAVNCALAIQDELREDDELRLRIGIHLGDVSFEGGRVLGDGVNVAARIRPLADPGGICVSDEVQHSIQNQENVHTRSLGEQRLKNVPRPVHVFEVTGRASPPPPAVASWRPQRVLRGWGVLVLAVALLAGAGVWWTIRTPAPIRSLAVLPFENLSGDPEQEYFADGMTEALIGDLARLGALRVISRTSVMHYKGQRRPLPEIARELDVDAVIEGTVMRAGDRVRITAQLIDARSDEHLWAERYERDLREIFALQNEVARAVASQIELALTPQETARLSRAPSTDPEAHEAYLKGRYFWGKFTQEGLQKAIEHFERATELDPDHALAYVGLADTYTALQDWGDVLPADAMQRAKAAALAALKIDEGLAEAHASLAVVLMRYEWDWPGAEREFERALELNPGSAMARFYYSQYLTVHHRFEAAIEQASRAREFDPLSLVVNTNVGHRYYLARQYEEAIDQLRGALEMDPGFVIANLWLAWAYTHAGALDEGLAQMQRTVEVSGQAPAQWPELAYVLARAGKRQEAERLLEDVIEWSRPRYGWPTLVAEVYVGLGDHDKAIEWLERAYRDRSSLLPEISVHPAFDELRSDPRFQELLRRIGLPTAPIEARKD